ncbi:DUF362 domain-containing protein [Deferrisoma palaeochoriense]
MASDVYFCGLRTSHRRTLFHKIDDLLERAGLAQCVGKGDLVAVKLHFGERGNASFLRPVFVRRVVDRIRGLGAKPFLTDTNTLYRGSRTEAVSHLETAILHGFTYATVGAPVIIAGGLRGNTGVRVPVPGVHFREASIAAEIAHADALVVLSHFKGHDVAGFGGAVKNLGMGCATREGKMAQHSGVSPKVKAKRCVACGECARWCAHGAIAVGEKASIDPDRCVGCGECILTCPTGAIQIRWTEGPQSMQEKMAEYACAALHGKRDRAVFLNFVAQVSPACDCHAHNDAPIVADVGLASGRDPVALDQACVDLVNACPGRPDSALKAHHEPGGDKFRGVYPEIDWSVQLVHAERIGLGSRRYTLTRLDE